jgi:hypothetical protein
VMFLHEAHGAPPEAHGARLAGRHALHLE